MASADYTVSLQDSIYGNFINLGDHISLNTNQKVGEKQSGVIRLVKVPNTQFYKIGLYSEAKGLPSDIALPYDPLANYKDYYLNTENGALSFGPVKNGWHSAMWEITPLNDRDPYYRIQNRWKKTYLVSKNGKLMHAASHPNAKEALWMAIPKATTLKSLRPASSRVIRFTKDSGYNAKFQVQWMNKQLFHTRFCNITLKNKVCDVVLPPNSTDIKVLGWVDMPVKKDKPVPDIMNYVYISNDVACIKATGTIFSYGVKNCDTSSIGVPLRENEKVHSKIK